jgi:radical SAM protein with 4Fe4S-binding SPASM domain
MIKKTIDKTSNALKALISREITIECDRIPYQFHQVPMKKILNWIMVETSIALNLKKAWGWPTHLQIEPTNLCNLRCVLCPVTEGMDRPAGHMSFNTFKKVIDEVGDYIFLIILWDWGEPFLNSKIYDMIAYAKNRQIKIVSSTNGHIFAQGDHAEKLVRSGIDSVIFAIDGMTQETYVRYRQGGRLETVLSGLRKVVEAKEKLGSNTPVINFRFVVSRHNEHEIPRLKAFAKSLRVDVLTLKTMNPHDGMISDPEAYNFLPKDKRYHRFKYKSKNPYRLKRSVNPCKSPWNTGVIHWDGTACRCTFDPHGRYPLGDLTKKSFKEIWFGPALNRLRRRLREDYEQIASCSRCTNAYESGTLGAETIAEAHFF